MNITKKHKNKRTSLERMVRLEAPFKGIINKIRTWSGKVTKSPKIMIKTSKDDNRS
jgi:hypothetical protein